MSNAPCRYNSNVCSLPRGATRTWTEHGCLNNKKAESWFLHSAQRRLLITLLILAYSSANMEISKSNCISVLGELKKKEKRNERPSWKFHKCRVIKAARWIIRCPLNIRLVFIAPQGSTVAFYDFLCFCISAINMSPSRLWIFCMYIYLWREIRIPGCEFRAAGRSRLSVFTAGRIKTQGDIYIYQNFFFQMLQTNHCYYNLGFIFHWSIRENMVKQCWDVTKLQDADFLSTPFFFLKTTLNNISGLHSI